jgi:hypothetical protein
MVASTVNFKDKALFSSLPPQKFVGVHEMAEATAPTAANAKVK